MDPARIVGNQLVWQTIQQECEKAAADEPLLAGFLYNVVLSQPNLESALSHILATKLENGTLSALSLRRIIYDVVAQDEPVMVAVLADLQAVVRRDPACPGYANPVLYFKGFHAIQAYRVAHHYWMNERKALAHYLQSRISEVFAVDIHPGARLGKSIMFDHATSVVIGETAVVEDEFSMLHEVTLGGSGKEGGDRHPKVGRGVMIGAGAKVLGNIKVGDGAKIGAGSVVLRDVPPHTTVAGVPARVVNVPPSSLPAHDMDQNFGDPDPYVYSI